MVTEQNSQDMDASKLSPTPRKSERDKTVKNYKTLNDVGEEEENPLGQNTINLSTGANQGVPQASKTPSQRSLVTKDQPPKPGKNLTVEKMTEFLERMKNHKHAHLMDNVQNA